MNNYEIEETYAQIDSLNRDSYKIRFSDTDTGIQKSQQAISINKMLSEVDQYAEGLVDSLNNLAWFKLKLTEYVEAEIINTESLRRAKKRGYKRGEARALGMTGRIAMYRGDYGQALECHINQLNLCDEIQDFAEKSTAYSYLGHLYSRLKRSNEAIDSYKQSIFLDEQLNNLTEKAAKLVNISITYNKIDEPKKSLEYSLEGLELAKQTNNIYTQSWAHGSIAEAYRKLGKLDEAISYLREKHALATLLEDQQQQLDVQIEFGNIYFEQQEHEQSISHFIEGINLSEEKGFRPHLARCYKGLSAAYRGAGEFEQALIFFIKYHDLIEDIHTSETAEKEAEILRLKTEELANMVSQRTEELSKANDQLELAFIREKELSELKSKIITTVSHEFRTPLSSIKVSADMLKKFEAKMTAEKRVTLFARIDSSIGSLSSLIEDILSVESIEPTKEAAHLLPMRFSEMAETLISNLTGEFGKQMMRIHASFEKWDGSIIIDLERVQKILFHLIDNSLKFSALESPVELFITVSPAVPSVSFKIVDQGVGIIEEKADLIWEPFYRLGETNMNAGLGLGLFMARRLSQQLGGEVSFEANKNGKGSTFELVLPVGCPKLGSFAESRFEAGL